MSALWFLARRDHLSYRLRSPSGRSTCLILRVWSLKRVRCSTSPAMDGSSQERFIRHPSCRKISVDSYVFDLHSGCKTGFGERTAVGRSNACVVRSFLSTNDIMAALKLCVKECALSGHTPLAALWRNSLWDPQASERPKNADLVRHCAGSADFADSAAYWCPGGSRSSMVLSPQYTRSHAIDLLHSRLPTLHPSSLVASN